MRARQMPMPLSNRRMLSFTSEAFMSKRGREHERRHDVLRHVPVSSSRLSLGLRDPCNSRHGLKSVEHNGQPIPIAAQPNSIGLARCTRVNLDQ